MHLAHRFVRFCVKPLESWYQRELVVRQLERLDQLGAGVSVPGSIHLGSPGSVRMGDNVHLSLRFHIKGAGKVTIGSHVRIGDDVLILTENHKYDANECLPYGKERIFKDVTIGDCVWICDRVLIMPGANIGEGAVLGAGAVVASDIPPLAIVTGSPARVLLKRDADFYWRLKNEQKFQGWPRTDDMIAGKRMVVKRKPR